MNQVSPGTDRRPMNWGALVFGLLILGAGGYLLLKDTLKVEVPDISWEMFWPLVLIAIGVVVLLRAVTGDTWRSRRRDR